LKVVLQQRHLQTYGLFCREYDKAAQDVDAALVGRWPSRAQFHRWLSGDLKGLPYPGHCRILEKMLPGYSAAQLFEPWQPGETTEQAAVNGADDAASDAGRRNGAHGLAGLSAAFATRAEFSAQMPPSSLFDDAAQIRAAGLSLNMLCQQYPDQRIRELIENGMHLHCLFLDPDGTAIQTREREEGYTDRSLSTLTKLNIDLLIRLRNRLSDSARERLTVAIYDETIRFNIILIDQAICVMQPYLPQARGVDSPTFVFQRRDGEAGMYATFEQVFTELAERSTPL
jgi:hypothetical protein